jgi:transcriptional regulator with XRE-family HTH domain
MLAKNSTKKPTLVDKKIRRFHHDLDYAYMNIDVDTTNASHRLGRALRALRIARNWTLNDFERASGGAVKAVVLGSYERGSRSITVSKLEIIVAIYGVPITAVLQSGNELSYAAPKGVIIDLRRLREVRSLKDSRSVEALHTFTSGIANTRRDYNGEIISLRGSDVDFLAIMTSSSREKMLAEFATLKVIFTIKD